MLRTGWNEDHLKGKLLLECGCGAGNDTEILLDLGAKVISFDYSNSVEIALIYNKHHPNLFIFQADIYNIPLKAELCDIVYCHRVIQHTPNPELAFYSIIKYLNHGGQVFLHSYGITPGTRFHYHYILRPITRRMNYLNIYQLLKIVGPFLYWLVGKIHKNLKIKFVKDLLLRIIPFDNLDYALTNSQLTKKEKYYFSLLHVFDRLTPKYDNPNSASTVIKWFFNAKLKNINLRGINPVLLTAFKN